MGWKEVGGVGAGGIIMVDVGLEPTIQKKHRLSTTPFVRLLGGNTECPPQVCHLSRSSESTHFLCLRRDVALFDSIKALDGFRDRRHVPPIYFLNFPEYQTPTISYETHPHNLIFE